MRKRILCYLGIGVLCVFGVLWWYWRTEAALQHSLKVNSIGIDLPPIPGVAEELEAEEEARRLAKRFPPTVILKGHYDGSHRVAISPDGSLILTASQDGTARLWDRSREVHRLEGHRKPPLCVAFSSDGKLAATGGSDGVAVVWDVASGDITAMLPGHEYNVSAVAFLPNGTLLTTSGSGCLRSWDVEREIKLTLHQEHRSRVMGLAVRRDGTRAYTAAMNRTMACWSLPSMKIAWTSDGQISGIDDASEEKNEEGAKRQSVVTNLRLSADERRLYTVRAGEGIDEWDAETGKHLRRLKGPAEVRAIALHPNGQHIAIDEWSLERLSLWELTPGDAPLRRVKRLDGPRHVHDLAFGPQGRFLVVAQGGVPNEHFRSGWQVAENGHVFLWDLSTTGGGDLE